MWILGTFDSLVFVCCVDSFDSTVFLYSVDLYTPFGSFSDESFGKQRVCYVGFYAHGWILCLSLLYVKILMLCSAEMLVNIHIPWVILGHSERRTLCGESNEVRCRKTERPNNPHRCKFVVFFFIDLDGFFLLWNLDGFFSPLILMASFTSDGDLDGFFRL